LLTKGKTREDMEKIVGEWGWKGSGAKEGTRDKSENLRDEKVRFGEVPGCD
jgi:hypothetical protein